MGQSISRISSARSLLVLPSVVLVYFVIVPIGGSIIGAEFPSLLKDLGMFAIGLAAYGAIFALVGARLKRPLVVGLVFAFGWEPGVLLFPGYLKRLTIAYYLQALVPHAMATRLDNERPPAGLQRSAPLCLSALTAPSSRFQRWVRCGSQARAVETRNCVLER